MMTDRIIRDLVAAADLDRPWHGARVTHYAPTLKSEPWVLSLTADDGNRSSTVTIPMRKLESANLRGNKRGIVEILDEALDRLHALFFPKDRLRNAPRAKRPPKGWRLFGRRRAVVLT